MDESNESSAAARRKALGAVVRALRGQRTQTELGTLLGNLSQATISVWENGQVDLTCEQVLQLERALGVRPGTVGMASGYVELDRDDFGTVGPAQAGPRNIMRIYLNTVDDAVEAIQAAEVLDLGVRLWNGRVQDETEDVLRDQWVVEIWDEPVDGDDEMVLGPSSGATPPA